MVEAKSQGKDLQKPLPMRAIGTIVELTWRGCDPQSPPSSVLQGLQYS